MKERIYKYDNIKALLIFLVVYGHLIFTFKNSDTDFIYRFIYMFHMPAFVFITGMFIKPNLRNIIKNIIIYIVFQILYVLTSISNPELYSLKSLSILYPHYLMWYIFNITLWSLTIPLIKSKSKLKTYTIIVIAAVLSIVSGCIKINTNIIDYQRIISLYIFFVLGYYFKNNNNHKKSYSNETKIKNTAFLLLLITIFILVCRYMPSWVLQFNRMYLTPIELFIRIFQIIFSLIIIHILIVLIPDKKIKYITIIGQNTLYIYLSHGFVTLLIRNLVIDENNSLILNIIMLVITVILCYTPIGIVEAIKKLNSKRIK